MKISDIKRLFSGLNRDDSPAFLKDGEYVDGLNIRTVSSEDEQESGVAETLRGEVEIPITAIADLTYYGEAIGGNFNYAGYDEVTIGSQVWMKKNWDANYPGSKVYDDLEANRDIYGGLYTWDQVMSSDFAPDGWRVPTEADVDALLTYLGGALVAGGKMKEPDTDHWLTPNTEADDSSGFKGLGGGKYDSAFSLLQENGLFWTSETPADLYDDWFLPSSLLLVQMYNNLKVFGVGGFTDGNYWSSTEFNATVAYLIDFSSGNIVGHQKSGNNFTRACRKFISLDVYALRDIGPAGGLIFYINGTTYYEAALTDESIGPWSNITTVAIGTTSTAINESQNNTNEIIAQVGHIASSAKKCDNLEVLSDDETVLALSYNSAEATKIAALSTYYLSVRLIKEVGTVNPLQDSKYTNILLNGKCIDPETRCLYVFYIDTYYGASWIIEINLDNRVQTVVYFDKYNAIGFDPLYKIYNARVVHGKLVWTDNKNPIYQMDISRAKKSFYYKIGYGYFPAVTEWSTTVTYEESQIVSDGNYFFSSVTMGNLNHQPKTDDGTYWTRLCLIEDAYYSMNIENFYLEPAPPKMPPSVEYIADENRRINSLKQTLFQFAYRYVYMDWRKSTFSPASIVALPSGEEEANTGLATEQISINNGLKITVNSGGEEVRAIEIIARSSVDPSKWFLIETLNKFDEEERAGEISLLEKLDKALFTITIPGPVVSNINIADPDGAVPFTITVPAPSMLLYYIDASVKVMSWIAIQSGAGEQKTSVITVFGGHPSTQIEHIPSWLTCIETGGGLPLIEGDPITDGMEIALYPTADNTGPYQSDNFKISDVYLNFINIFTEQAQPIDVPVVNPMVHPESPNEMTISDESGTAEIDSNWIYITFTPNHPSYGVLVNFTMNYIIWLNGANVKSGTFTAANLTPNVNVLLSMAPHLASAGDTITIYLWEGTIT